MSSEQPLSSGALVDVYGVTHEPGTDEYVRLRASLDARWSVTISSPRGERPRPVFPALKDALAFVKTRMDAPGSVAVITRIDPPGPVRERRTTG